MPSTSSPKGDSSLRRTISDLMRSLPTRSSFDPGRIFQRKGSSSTGLSPADSLGRTSQFIFWGRSEGNVEEYYRLGEVIGQGACGVVRMATDIELGGLLCCKSIRKGQLNTEQLKEVEHETDVLLHLRGHPNIVTIMGVFEDADNVHIIAELCSGPSLRQLMEQNNGCLNEIVTGNAMKAVLEVVAHCHAMGVLYRDIKPDHFLLSDNTSSAQLKAIDFGISIFLEPGRLHTVPAGTPSYFAPEVFEPSYGYPSDLWSCGVMMHQLLTGDFPFKGCSENDLYRETCIAKLDFDDDRWRRITEPCKDFLRRLLNPIPAQRMTAQEALQHIWITHCRPSPSPSKLRALASFRSTPSSLGTLREAPMSLSKGNKGQPQVVTPHVLLERMRGYSRMAPFKRVVMLQLVRQLLADGDLTGMQAMFGGIDTQKKGALAVDDVVEAFKKQGAQVDADEIQQLVRGADINGNGVIEPYEFLAASLNPALLEKRDLLSATFRHYDLDDDGSISRGDLKSLMDDPSTSDEERLQVTTMIVHMEGFEKVSFERFLALMMDTTAYQPGLCTSPRGAKPSSSTVRRVGSPLVSHSSAPALGMTAARTSGGTSVSASRQGSAFNRITGGSSGGTSGGNLSGSGSGDDSSCTVM